MADSLESSSFRRKMNLTPLGPKVSDLFSDILLTLDYGNMPLDKLLNVASALRSYMRYLYDYGLFDDRWERAVYSYREVLVAVKKRLSRVKDLDSLAEITRDLKPPIMARAYKKEYENLIDLYRHRSMEEGDLRWGMSEEDVRTLLGEPDAVDTVLSVAGSSFGKLLHYGDTSVLIIEGKVEEVFYR
ncbi:MAG: hypothetical protein GXO39_00780 [Thermotogae bacterium]|nr:hypothetical protein [Thermotogota bacterium]